MKNLTMGLASASLALLGQNGYAATDAVVQAVDAAKTTSASSSARDSVSATGTATNKMVPLTPTDSGWSIDTAVLMYKERARVSALEPVVSASKDFGGERVLNLKLVLDGLTGPSPNGAAPASVVQTFTSPSGAGTSKVAAGALPVEKQFKDTRVAVSAGWSQPLTSTLKGSVGANFSKEYDFLSAGVNASVSKDLNEKNTTISAGASYEFDVINPVGGAPVGLSDTALARKEGNQTKSVAEAMLGVTQLLSPKALYQINYSVSSSQGYMNDPYKLLTVLDDNLQLIQKSSDTYTYVFEQRPDARLRHALYQRLKYKIGPAILDASYRYTTDDWGVDTHTADVRVRYELARNRYYIEPHVRYYTQTAADFYAPYVLQSRAVQYASADSRLGAFKGMTLGAKFGWNLGKNQEVNLRVERYTQTASHPSTLSTGSLAGQVLQPDLTAYMAQIGYRLKW